MCPILPNLSRKQGFVLRHTVTMRVQLDVDTVSRNLLNLSRIHQLQNSFRRESAVVDPQRAGQTGSEVVLLNASHLVPLGQLNQPSHNPVPAWFRAQVQRSLQPGFLSAGDDL